ncbi:hypothetical protein [Allorhizocola rhizosphaerae]|uniref:hypothetical protein n=1 Tax=Allorhizocola rhizosphaerae TaxID=1872709 RepID=UPI000E3D244F|nr:hypothetical protein [Allorhizocola rhizosphaerae]
MPHVLGIDLGNSHVAAAVSRAGASGWTVPEVICESPAVLRLTPDGTLVTGEHGDGQAVRDFVARVGDDVPMVVGGEPCRPQTLAAMLAMWAVERTSAWEREHAEHIVLGYPSAWGQYRRELLRAALREVGLHEVTLLPKPVIAAEGHPARVMGLYSLGRKGYSAAVLRRSRPAGFEMLACLEGVPPLGSEDMLAAGSEEEVRSAVRLTVDTLLWTVRSAGLQPDQLDDVLLVGAAAEVPLVEETIRADFPNRVTMATDPQFTAATGAARVASRLLSGPVSPLPAQRSAPPYDQQPSGEVSVLDESPPRPPVRITSLKLPRRRALTQGRSFSLFGL